MKMMGIRMCSALSRACSSRPDMPGMRMSAIRHEGRCGAPESRNSSADANARAGNPASLSRPCSAPRINSSSSTMATNLDSCGGIREYRPPGYRPQSSIGFTWGSLDPGRHPDQLRERPRLHLPHDAAAMDLDRDLAGSQLRGDLLVEHPRDDEGHDLALPRRQPGVTVLQRRQLVLLLPGDLVALERLLDRIEQVLVLERLGEELDRPGLH